MTESKSLFHPTAQKVWDVLVTYAGASADPGTRMQFSAFWERRYDAREFRFCGSLGFGGKFWASQHDGWHVSCYREDLTPEREAAIGETNLALARLLEEVAGMA